MKNVKRRQRLRGTCKWGGVTLCVLLLALWLASGWWDVKLGYVNGALTDFQDISELRLVNGGIAFSVSPWGRSPTLGFYNDNDLLKSPHLETGEFQSYWTSSDEWTVGCPLWLPFLLIALPTGFLFWSDHRRRMRTGCCAQCGYDLTGNTSGKCPECGAERVKTTK